MKSGERGMNKPIVSLCIPTNGMVKWIIPVIESIYSQNVNNDLFEVVITDNGVNSTLEQVIKTYDYPNLKYYKSDYKGFTNQIFALKQGAGLFRKMLNHRSLILPGKLQALIDFINNYKETRPIIYLSDNNLVNSDSVIKCNNCDELLYNLHYWITWSAGIGVWEEDMANIENVNANKIFPHISLVFDIRKDGHCIIWNDKYQKMLSDAGKGGYNLYEAFSVVFLDLLQDYEKRGIISRKSYKRTKKMLFFFLTELYLSEVLLPSDHSFDLSNIRKSVTKHYNNTGYILMIIFASYKYLKRMFKKIIKF